MYYGRDPALALTRHSRRAAVGGTRLLQCGYGRVGAHSIVLPAQAQPEESISGRRQTRMSARGGGPPLWSEVAPPCMSVAAGD